MANFDPIEIEKSLKGIDYPATRDDLVDTARENGADDDILNTLGELPERQYDTPTDVMEELGHEEEAVPTEGGVEVDPDDEDDDLSDLADDTETAQ